MPRRLADELLEEILTRLPPDDPVSLVRAAAVCPRWRRVVSTRSFRHRFAQRHRTAPMLGLFANLKHWSEDKDEDGDYYKISSVRFVRATRFRPEDEDRRDLCAFDARHGRVLLVSTLQDAAVMGFEVWDPVMNELWELPNLARSSTSTWNAGVVCADDACDHLDCRRKPFRVVFLDSGREKMRAFVYSSESGAWSGPTYGPPAHDGVGFACPALVGNTLHFLMKWTNNILKYDVLTGRMAMIVMPHDVTGDFPVLTTAEDGGLGLARVETRDEGGVTVECALSLWSMETGPEGQVLWQQKGMIALDTLLNVNTNRIRLHNIAFAHGIGAFFVATGVAGTDDEWFSIDKSEEVRKENFGDGSANGVVPYTSFYTPEFRQYGVPPA
ncbi:unnamed protein product [Urochloa decumbens]|uniref:F-box domain-containing protein n=1 Tax=Urochloa decumbens TaxID=240449 RepID=A0ABC9GXQ7_9POAL